MSCFLEASLITFRSQKGNGKGDELKAIIIIFLRLGLKVELSTSYEVYLSSRRKKVDLHLSKDLFLLDPDNLQLHSFLGLQALFCCPLEKIMQDVVNCAGLPPKAKGACGSAREPLRLEMRRKDFENVLNRPLVIF